MPTSARDAGVVEQQAAAADIGEVLSRLSHREIKELNMEPDAAMEIANRIAMACHFSTEFDTKELGPASGYTCPDWRWIARCGGRGQLSLPRRSRLDARRAAGRPR